MFKCEKCEKSFKTRQSYAGHMSSHNRGESYRLSRETSNSKLKRENINKPKKCKFCSKEFKTGLMLGGHTVRCKKNPDYSIINEKIRSSLKGKKLTDAHKKAMSEGMKLAHIEGRAWNIGKSRWNNKPSYPEEFFMKVIENEFEDKSYIREYPVSIYSIDFAWVSKKLAIEIDGEQHYRFDEYQERDFKKDTLLENNGWKILRIRWKDIYNNPQEYIKMAKKFIDEN